MCREREEGLFSAVLTEQANRERARQAGGLLAQSEFVFLLRLSSIQLEDSQTKENGDRTFYREVEGKGV